MIIRVQDVSFRLFKSRLAIFSKYFHDGFYESLTALGKRARDVTIIDGCDSHKGPNGLTSDDFTVFLQHLDVPS